MGAAVASMLTELVAGTVAAMAFARLVGNLLQAREKPSRRYLALMVAILLLVWAAMGNLGGTLKQMHPPDGVSGSVVDIANPLTDADSADALIGSWIDWHARTEAEAEYLAGVGRKNSPTAVRSDPGAVVAGWLGLDTLFAPLLAWIVVLLARRRLHFETGDWTPLLTLVPVIAAVYLAADWAENAATAVEMYGLRGTSAFGLAHWVVRGLSAIKLAAIGLAVIPIVASFAVKQTSPRSWVPSLRGQVARLQIPVAAVVVYAAVVLFLPGQVRPQLNDIMRTWAGNDDPWSWAWAFVATLGLSAVVWAIGVVVLSTERKPRRPESKPAGLAYLAAGLGVALAGCVVSDAADVLFPTLAIVGAAVGAAGLFMVFHPALTPPIRDPSGGVRSRRFLGGLTAAPIYVLALAYVRAADLSLGVSVIVRAIVLVALSSVIGYVLLFFSTRGPETGEKRSWPVRVARSTWFAVTVVSTAIGGWAFASPIDAGWSVGTFGLFAMWCASLSGILGLAQIAFRAKPRGLLHLAGFRRVPVVTLALALFATVSLLDSNIGYHKVVVSGERADPATARTGVGLEQVGAAIGDAAAGGVTPLFVIASSGGGARSAYWTSIVLNCLFSDVDDPALEKSDPEAVDFDACPGDPLEWNDVAVASGISGGSVGLAMFAASQNAGGTGRVDTTAVFDDGFVDPVVAQLLFGDTPNALVRSRSAGHDRARRLEEAWGRKLGDMEALKLFESQLDASGKVPTLPLLLLNSASIRDGCRINVSVADLAPTAVAEKAGERKGLPSCRASGAAADVAAPKPLASTRDLVDFVCDGEDVSLATAALLSARFPIVSPTGALQECAGAAESESAIDHVFAADGGYVDSSAASPLAEMLPSLVDILESGSTSTPSCVQPVVLQIDNGYVDSVAGSTAGRPPELLAPLIGYGSAGGARPDAYRQALELAAAPRACVPEEKRFKTYFHLYPESGPGVQAPLGWSLSRPARIDLRHQLGSSHNLLELCELASVTRSTGAECSPRAIARAEDAQGPTSPGDSLRQARWITVPLGLLAVGGVWSTVAIVRRRRSGGVPWPPASSKVRASG